MDQSEYIKTMLTQHYLNENNYVMLSPSQAFQEMRDASSKIRDIVQKYGKDIDLDDYVFFQQSSPLNNHISQLYGTPKLFKEKDSIGFYHMRPILLKCGSQPKIASKWIDVKLKNINICTHLKDIFDFLELIHNTKLPPNITARLVSTDAKKMYDNIDIKDTIATVEKYLQEITLSRKIDFDIDLLLELLEVVLTSNVFMFGDLYFKQISGIPMGTICAVMIANKYVAYWEEKIILPKYKDNFFNYKRYIDDVFTLWIDGINNLTIKDLEKDLH